MPISPRTYKDELTPDDTKLLAIIERTPYQAYTISELSIALSVNDDNMLIRVLKFFAFEEQLNRLITKKLVTSKIVNGLTYYISTKAI
jgi:hypothetical protein